MTSRERLLATLRGDMPDCVPVAPDFSQMIPCRMSGKPWWDLYLYNDPPPWEAYIACARHFDIDSLMDGYFHFAYPDETGREEWERFVVERTPERIVVQRSHLAKGVRVWADNVSVYYPDRTPHWDVTCAAARRPQIPDAFEPLTGVRPMDLGPQGLKRAKALMGDQGLVGVFVVSTVVLGSADDVYDYADHPEKYEALAEERVRLAEERYAYIRSLPEDCRPDFLCVGGSGTLIFQTVDMFRRIALPAVKRVIELATADGYPTHVHSCGPERELVRIFAEQTTLTVIDPLEPPPMGDCDLAELKRRYGDRIVLKGNLHTTDVMLRGTPEAVSAAARKAIDDGAAGGRFILSTGDQCGRDTPDANLHALVETARTYGRY